MFEALLIVFKKQHVIVVSSEDVLDMKPVYRAAPRDKVFEGMAHLLFGLFREKHFDPGEEITREARVQPVDRHGTE